MKRTEALLLLELDDNYSETALRQAYRDMLKVWHPDRFRQGTDLHLKALERTQRINAAYRVLGSNSGPSVGGPVSASAASQRSDESPRQDAAVGPLGKLRRTYRAKLTGLKNPRSIDVCERGVILHWRDGRTEVVPWTFIDAVRYSASVSKVYGLIPISADRLLWIRQSSGKEIFLTDGLKGISDFYQDVASATLPRLFRAAEATLEASGTVDFGTVVLSTDGVSTKPVIWRRAAFFPWPQVARLGVYDGMVHLFTTDAAKSQAVWFLGDTWNPGVLLEMVERRKASA